MIASLALWTGYAVLVIAGIAVLFGALIGLALLGNVMQHKIKDHFGGWAALHEFIEWRRANEGAKEPFQTRVRAWTHACFGAEMARNVQVRVHRFVEEALELAQAFGCTAKDAHALVDYVFGRPVGEKRQEVGGTLVTLAALCDADDLDMTAAGEVELARNWTKVGKIRAKQAAAPKDSPLPGAAPAEAVEGQTIQCWSCKQPLALAMHSEHDGICPFCSAEIDLTE